MEIPGIAILPIWQYQSSGLPVQDFQFRASLGQCLIDYDTDSCCADPDWLAKPLQVA